MFVVIEIFFGVHLNYTFLKIWFEFDLLWIFFKLGLTFNPKPNFHRYLGSIF